MRARRLALAAAIVVLGALLFGSGSAQACSCIERSPSEALREADAAIVGELRAVVPRSPRVADYRFWVQRVYKRGRGIGRGVVISVRSARDSAACGLPQREGRRYGLLLDEVHVEPRMGAKGDARDRGGWAGGLCGVVAPRKLRLAADHASGRDAGSASCTS